MLLILARNRAIKLVSEKLDKRTKPKPESIQFKKNMQMDYIIISLEDLFHEHACMYPLKKESKLRAQHIFQLFYSRNARKKGVKKNLNVRLGMFQL
jgi:hypothetical protein